MRYVSLLVFFFPAVLPAMVSADAAGAGRSPAKTVTLVYENRHNPPRALGSGTRIDWDKPGLTLELLRQVGERLGIRFEFRRMPWKRGLFLLERNEVDGVFHASYKREREKIGVYPGREGQPDESRALFDQSYVLYKLRGGAADVGEQGVTGVTGYVGAVSGYSIVKSLETMGLKVFTANTLEENLENLVQRRISAFAMLENMGDDYLGRHSDRYGDVVKVSRPLESKPYYLVLSHAFVREHPVLAERIWNTAAEIANSEAFRLIEEGY